MKKTKLLLLLVLTTSVLATASAKVRLPRIFQSGMVLQREKPIPLWGTAEPKALVVVQWKKHRHTTLADSLGQWRINLPKARAGGPYIIKVWSGADGAEQQDVLTLTDVLVGDVWLCF